MSIMDLYRRESFNSTLRIGTPDPTKYHQSSTTVLESSQASLASKMPANSRFAIPGVIIPHATRYGGSMGHDSEKPQKVYIDPEFTNKQVVVDLAKIRRNPEKMGQVIDRVFRKGYQDEADAMIESFAAFAEPIKNVKAYIDVEETVEPERESPLQMPGLYVVPKAKSGGQEKVSSFVKRTRPEPEVEKEEVIVESTAEVPPMMLPVVKAAKSLHAELNGGEMKHLTTHPMQKVTFELPMAGRPDSSLGQFSCFFTNVLKEDKLLILIYDHSQPAQMVWFPPSMEDPETGEPMSIAVLVHGMPDKLYKAYPTDIRFKYNSEEFCILTIEKEKVYERE